MKTVAKVQVILSENELNHLFSMLTLCMYGEKVPDDSWSKHIAQTTLAQMQDTMKMVKR